MKTYISDFISDLLGKGQVRPTSSGSKFSWYNIFVNFVVNPSFTKFVFTKIFMGVAFVTCAVASVLIIRSSKKLFQLQV